MLATQNMKMEYVDVEIAYQVLGKQGDLCVQVIYEHRELADKSAVRQGRGGTDRKPDLRRKKNYLETVWGGGLENGL